MKQNLRCIFFPNCGGCSFLDLSDEEYQKVKIENLKKDLADIYNIAKNPLNDRVKTNDDILKKLEFFSVGPHSRRKIVLQLNDKNKLGFFAKGTKNLVEIDVCYIAQKEISAIIVPLQNIFKNFETNVVSQITITAFDNILDVVFSCKREFNFSQLQLPLLIIFLM